MWQKERMQRWLQDLAWATWSIVIEVGQEWNNRLGEKNINDQDFFLEMLNLQYLLISRITARNVSLEFIRDDLGWSYIFGCICMYMVYKVVRLKSPLEQWVEISTNRRKREKEEVEERKQRSLRKNDDFYVLEGKWWGYWI